MWDEYLMDAVRLPSHRFPRALHSSLCYSRYHQVGFHAEKLWFDSRHTGSASSIIEPKQERGAVFSLLSLGTGWTDGLSVQPCGEENTTPRMGRMRMREIEKWRKTRDDGHTRDWKHIQLRPSSFFKWNIYINSRKCCEKAVYLIKINCVILV